MNVDERTRADLEEVRRKAARMRRARRSERPLWHVLAQASAVGWMFAVPAVLGALAGGLVARAIGRPVAVFAGLVPGVVVGFYLFFRQVRRSLADDEEP